MLMDSMPTKSLLYLGCDKAVLSGCEGAAAEVNVKPPPSSLSSSSAEGGMELEPSSSSNSTSSSPTPPPSSGTAASSLDILSGAAETIDRNAISNSSDFGLSCGGGDDSSVANAKEEVEGGGGGNANGSSSSALATTTSVLVLDGAAAAAVATTTCTYTDTNAGDNTSASTAFERMPGGNDADTGGDDDVPSTSSNAIASNDNNSASTDGSPSRYEYTYIDNNDGNIVLSYHFLPYKEMMYQAFRDLGLHAPREVESSVVEKVMHAFQGGSEPLAGRRFLKHLYRSKDSQCVAVTNDVALESELLCCHPRPHPAFLFKGWVCVK